MYVDSSRWDIADASALIQLLILSFQLVSGDLSLFVCAITAVVAELFELPCWSARVLLRRPVLSCHI